MVSKTHLLTFAEEEIFTAFVSRPSPAISGAAVPIADSA
jgi:hypothetical protein